MKKEGLALNNESEPDKIRVLSEKYEQEVAYILQILGEDSEELKYSLVWDDTSFRDLNVSPSQLETLSHKISVQVLRSTLIVDCARFMRDNSLDSSDFL